MPEGQRKCPGEGGRQDWEVRSGTVEKIENDHHIIHISINSYSSEAQQFP